MISIVSNGAYSTRSESEPLCLLRSEDLSQDVIRSEINRVLATPVEYVHSKDFRESNRAKWDSYLEPMPINGYRPRLPKAPPGSSPFIRSLYEVPLYTQEQERHEFRKMNLFRHQAKLLQSNISNHRPIRLSDRMNSAYSFSELRENSGELCNDIFRHNQRLVVSIAKTFATPKIDLYELISEGGQGLRRAIELFDYSKGYKFGTYATYAIRNKITQLTRVDRRRATRFSTGIEFDSIAAKDEDEEYETRKHDARRDVVGRLIEQLPPRLQTVIQSRFGLADENGNYGAEPQTLNSIGSTLRLTKQRIQQLTVDAVREMRKYAETHAIDLESLIDD